MRKKILIVEDESEIYEPLSRNLENYGNFDTQVCTCVADAMRAINAPDADYDLILLDMRLPDGDGMTVLKHAKEKQLAVLVLTAIDEEYKLATYVELADDYAPKETKTLVLIKKIQKTLSRREQQTDIIYRNIRIDTQRGIVFKNDRSLVIPTTRYKLLLLLMQNIGVPMRNSVLLRDVWDVDGDFVSESTLRKSIQRLREQIEDDPKNPEIIITVQDGYMIRK